MVSKLFFAVSVTLFNQFKFSFIVMIYETMKKKCIVQFLSIKHSAIMAIYQRNQKNKNIAR